MKSLKKIEKSSLCNLLKKVYFLWHRTIFSNFSFLTKNVLKTYISLKSTIFKAFLNVDYLKNKK